MDVLLCVNDSCALNNCYSKKCNKQQEKYCFSRANIFASGDIELNPGPANAYMLLQSRLAQQGLSTIDVGGDCFFRAVSHQLYGEPSYHMNIRCVGVQYMRTNPERFIESMCRQEGKQNNKSLSNTKLLNYFQLWTPVAL